MKNKLAILLTLLLLLPIYAGNQVKLTLAGGGDLVVNGHFSTATTGWTAGGGATLASVAGGKSGNCLRITCDGSNNPEAWQVVAVTAGKRLKLIVYAKAGTYDYFKVMLYDVTNATWFYDSGTTQETAGDWSTEVTNTFTIPTGSNSIRVYLRQTATAGAGTTFFFDTITLKEIPTKLTLAGGGQLVVNGHFSTVTTGWASYNSAVLASAGSGKSGNCLSVTENGESVPYAVQFVTVTEGKRYIFSGYVKAGTENEWRALVYDTSNAVFLSPITWAIESAGDWSTQFTYTFTIPSGCSLLRLSLDSNSEDGEGFTIYFDTVTLKEIPTKVTLH